MAVKVLISVQCRLSQLRRWWRRGALVSTSRWWLDIEAMHPSFLADGDEDCDINDVLIHVETCCC
ncbi:hypothetical protein CCMA1212_009855 [Trichoderma ghanense]|uniref:Uncharacterized protein n=1 Tax=Trichoderma ghanense TaxID=65468 RepID=A0ABY2GR11_9HYPO